MGAFSSLARRAGGFLALGASIVMLNGCAGEVAAEAGFSPRPETPRLAPVDPADPALSEAQKAMLASRPDYNIYKTLAHHPRLYSRWSPLGQILLNGSSLEPRHREMLMLRMGWLCQAEYEWAQHARIATTSAGMTAEEVHRIAEGPDAEGWTEFERAILTAVDEMRYDALISDATWAALSAEYTDQQIMEALFTAAQYQLVSMALNSLGVQLDPELEFRLPDDLPAPALAGRPDRQGLSQPRIPALAVAEMNEEQRAVVTPQIREDGGVLNLYATMANHPQLYGPRASFGLYLMREGLLPAQTRELLIMRTSWLNDAAYEWAHHAPLALEAGLTEEDIARIREGPSAEGWSEEQRAVLSAADELRREAFITDATWAALEEFYNPQQMVEVIYTVGGYTMTAIALNSFGVQVEPGYPAYPG